MSPAPMHPGPHHLPPRRRMPGSRRAAMRHALETAVAHDHPVGWRWSRRGAVLFATIALALAGGGAVAYALSRPPTLHAASGAGSDQPATSTARANAAGPVTASPGGASGAGASTATTNTGGIPPVCAASQLSFTVGPSDGSMGRLSFPVMIRNASAAACNLYGYPGLQMLTATGGQLPTTVVRNATMFGLPPEQMVVLTPGEEAFFALSFSDGTGYAGLSCPASARVEITPPNAYTPATITWQIAPYPQGNGACGTIQVSYVVTGTPNQFM